MKQNGVEIAQIDYSGGLTWRQVSRLKFELGFACDVFLRRRGLDPMDTISFRDRNHAEIMARSALKKSRARRRRIRIEAIATEIEEESAS